MTIPYALPDLGLHQLARVTGGKFAPPGGGGGGGIPPIQLPTRSGSKPGGVNQCENPKHVPAGGSQLPIIGGGTVLAPTWPCTDIKKHP
jgi:hypothetical protein